MLKTSVCADLISLPSCCLPGRSHEDILENYAEEITPDHTETVLIGNHGNHVNGGNTLQPKDVSFMETPI